VTTDDPRAATDAEICAALTHRHARTFAAASRFLPAEKRRAAFAVYAFCRVADDLVDEARPGDATSAREALDRHRAALIDARQGRPTTPLFRELRWAMQRYDIPAGALHELLTALARDLEPRPMATWEELAHYCEGVASTVGVMCAHVFGLPTDGRARMRALALARTLGVAMQLTNILRDVGEDAARGRCYLPTDDLAAFGVARDEVLGGTIAATDARWQRLMRHQVARARTLYAAAEPGLALVAPDARCCATVCARGYATILRALEGIGYDSLQRRARVGAATKLRIMAGAWLGTRRWPTAARDVGGAVPVLVGDEPLSS
jgi:phytoene synthase